MAVTIEHAYDTPAGVVVFQPYTVTGGKASASGDPVIGELTDGELRTSSLTPSPWAGPSTSPPPRREAPRDGGAKGGRRVQAR